MKVVLAVLFAAGVHGATPTGADLKAACYTPGSDRAQCAGVIASAIVGHSEECFQKNSADESSYQQCTKGFCGQQCGTNSGCESFCEDKASPLFGKFASRLTHSSFIEKSKALRAQVTEAEQEEDSAMQELEQAEGRMKNLNKRIASRAESEIKSGYASKGEAELKKVQAITNMEEQVDSHLAQVRSMRGLAEQEATQSAPSFVQTRSMRLRRRGPEDDLAKEMTHDLEMNFNKIAPFGKEDTARELQDHAAKTQDTLVDAVENAEVAEIKRAVFRALTRLRAATIKEFDTIARLETQAIDAYNDAHHYRAENPLAHLHEDEAPVETDKLKSFH